MDRYRAYNERLVPVMFERWSDPEMHICSNESFYRNELKKPNDYTISDNIYKSNETTTNIAYNSTTTTTTPTSTATSMFIPYFGSMQPNASAAVAWHQQPDQIHPNGSYLSSDATPFIPTTKSRARKFSFPFNIPLFT